MKTKTQSASQRQDLGRNGSPRDTTSWWVVFQDNVIDQVAWIRFFFLVHLTDLIETR